MLPPADYGQSNADATADTAIALFDLPDVLSPDELKLTEGERLVVKSTSENGDDGWWVVVNKAGVEGVVPANYVRMEPKAPPPSVTKKKKKKKPDRAIPVVPAKVPPHVKEGWSTLREMIRSPAPAAAV